jgi:hypothetical protein
MSCFEQPLELFAAHRQSFIRQRQAVDFERVEDDENGGSFKGSAWHLPAGIAQPNLKGSEIDATVVIDNNDLAVDQRADWQATACLDQLREPRPKIAAVAAQQLNCACGSVPEKTTKTIQLGLVPPRFAPG